MTAKSTACLYTLIMAACGNGGPTDTVDFLAANPSRLKEVLQQCHEHHEKMGDAECDAASEAFRRHFMGDARSTNTRRP